LLGVMRRRARSIQRKWRRESVLPFPNWLEPEFVKRMDLRAVWEVARARSANHNHHRGMAHDSLWENIFMVADPGFTGVSVQTRFPFFDLRLFTFMQSVPPEPWCRSKHLLRSAMQGRLPGPLLNRPKTPLQGFPHRQLLQERGFPAWMQTLVALPALSPYVERQNLSELIKDPASMTPSSFRQLASVLTFAYWLNQST
jgi:asparagine synthase (glutamine-hydrolysing)